MEAEQPDAGPAGVGTRWREVSKVLGRRSEWTTEVTDLQPPTRISSRAVEGKLQDTVTNTTQPENGGTRFTHRVEVELGLGGVLGRLADPSWRRPGVVR